MPSDRPFDEPVLRPITRDAAERWVAKARERAQELLAVAGPTADPAPVVADGVPSVADGMYGGFMVAWLDPDPPVRRVRHLPDGAFFIELLRRAYAPVLARRPDLARVLEDDGRFEMSLTNDVLQIQLATLEPGYSMVRHHALMLFAAALWLDEPRRSSWLDLYDELVGELEAGGTWPDLDALAATESRAFRSQTRLAERSLTPAGADALLADPAALADILDYQRYAAVAIGLLWREYRAVPEPDRLDWWARALSHGYVDPGYLTEKWMEHR
jgi:hypothetical protein